MKKTEQENKHIEFQKVANILVDTLEINSIKREIAVIAMIYLVREMSPNDDFFEKLCKKTLEQPRKLDHQ